MQTSEAFKDECIGRLGLLLGALTPIAKVSFAVALIASLWIPSFARPAAIGLGALMLGAFVMHLKVKDPLSKATPSVAVLAMCAAITLL